MPRDDEKYTRRRRLLADFFEGSGRLPSYSEMLGLFGLRSKNTVAAVVRRFLEDGTLGRDAGGRLVPGRIGSGVRILGAVEAGFPSPAEEELVDTISLDQYLISNKDATFVLRVSGRSMSGAGIEPGDLALVERGRTPLDGDIVIAEVDGQWTMKRFEKRGGKVVLMPANPDFQPIRPKHSLKVAGVVTAVVRKYH